tara:strand:- start:199 stop:1230 length:1032 start_codon:yes stop_codon:yes gene_type:complete
MCLFENCNNNVCTKKYGGYCNKHKKEYLCKSDLIIYDRFTNKESDYLKKDIIKSIKNINGSPPLYEKWKKIYLYNILREQIQFFSKFSNDIETILLIQKKIKKKPTKINKLRGEGFFNKKICNNTVDFFTFDSINDIEDKYFFSYKDNNNLVWFFDIRSFNKLIEMTNQNPYTTEEIPHNIIIKSKKLNKLLKLTDKDDIVDEYVYKTKTQIIKQKIIDIFSQLEQYGFESNFDWFTRLNIVRLRKLYSNLEDIWNYRLQLSSETKYRICPPNGLVFNIPISQVCSITDKEEIQEIILNEVLKFNNAIQEDDKKLGYMYFLIGLASVSRDCYISHQWIIATIN